MNKPNRTIFGSNDHKPDEVFTKITEFRMGRGSDACHALPPRTRLDAMALVNPESLRKQRERPFQSGKVFFCPFSGRVSVIFSADRCYPSELRFRLPKQPKIPVPIGLCQPATDRFGNHSRDISFLLFDTLPKRCMHSSGISHGRSRSSDEEHQRN